MTGDVDKPKRGRPSNADKMRAALLLEDEIGFETVKQQSFSDPIMGAPMRFMNAEGEEETVEPGLWWHHDYAHLDIVEPDSKLPRNMPVQALGIDSSGQSYYFLNTLGHVVELKGSSGKGDFELLFAGRNDYLFWLFPRKNKAGLVVGWEADYLKQALTKWAGWCGTYDADDNLRGRGMWRDARGRAVFHAGNAILIDGKWVRPGRYGKNIYAARTETGKPKAWPDLPDAGEQVYRAFCTWNWERPDLDPKIQLGWVMTAKMGAALFRRPAVWLTGPRGSGKTYLQVFLRSLMHESLLASSNATQAYIYQKLGKDCIPCLVDEQEAAADTRVTDRLLDLVRASYSGDDLGRGDKDGKAKTHVLRSSFLASSIAKPTTESSDDSRMALLSIRHLTKVPDQVPYTEAEAYRWGQVLTKRCIDWFPRWDDLLNRMETAMRTRKGHTARSLDTFAPFMAGYHIALYDDMPTVEQFAEYAALTDPSQLVEIATQLDDWEKCMMHLLSAMPEHMRNHAEKTIGQVLTLYLSSSDVGLADKSLRGLRVSLYFKKGEPPTKDNAYLFIPNVDPGLVDLFSGTAWAGRKGNAGTWNGVLKYAPKHLWTDGTSTKGGFGAVRGLAFRVEELMKYLGGETGEEIPVLQAGGNAAAAMPEPPEALVEDWEASPFDPPEGY